MNLGRASELVLIDERSLVRLRGGVRFARDHATGRRMSVVATVSLPADQFPLGRALEVHPGIQMRLETIVPTGHGVMPYVWVETEELDEIIPVLEQNQLIRAVLIIDEAGDETLIRIDWDPEVNGFIEAAIAADAVVLEGQGTGDDWTFRLRFDDHNDLSRFFEVGREKDLSLVLGQVHNPTKPMADRATRLTEEQREALTLALEQGYFDIPRCVTLNDLGDALGISDSAVSQRLRRAISSLIAYGVLDDR